MIKFEKHLFDGGSEKTDEDDPGAEKEIPERPKDKQSHKIKRRLFGNTARAAAIAGLGLLSGTSAASGQEQSEARKVPTASPQEIKIDTQIYDTKIEKNAIPTYQEIVERQKEREKLIDAIKEAKIYIKHEKDHQERYLDPAEMNGREVHVDGSVVGIQLKSSENLEVNVNGKSIYSSVPESGRRDELKNDYTYSASRHSNLPLTSSEQVTVQVGFSGGPTLLEFEINQDVFDNVDKVMFRYSDDQDLSEHVDTTQVMYLGDYWEETVREIPNIDKKIEAAAHGASQAEKALNASLIDTLGVIESKRANAFRLRLRGTNSLNFENKSKTTMFFYTELLEETSERDLFVIGRHEALHGFIKKAGYLDNEDFNKLYRKTDNKTFQFINESTFFNLSSGGHSRNNVDELATSLMNSLLSIERLEDKLIEHVNSSRERKEILDWYKKAVRLMKDHANTQIQTEESVDSEDKDRLDQFGLSKKFFQDKLDYLEKLENRLPQ